MKGAPAGGRRDVCTGSASRGGCTQAISLSPVPCISPLLSLWMCLCFPSNLIPLSFSPALSHPSLHRPHFSIVLLFFLSILVFFFLILPSPSRLPLKPMTVNFQRRSWMIHWRGVFTTPTQGRQLKISFYPSSGAIHCPCEIKVWIHVYIMNVYPASLTTTLSPTGAQLLTVEV